MNSKGREATLDLAQTEHVSCQEHWKEVQQCDRTRRSDRASMAACARVAPSESFLHQRSMLSTTPYESAFGRAYWGKIAPFGAYVYALKKLEKKTKVDEGAMVWRHLLVKTEE